jgi:diguanylate cyclase (GGDEF)-like protein
MAVSAAIGCLSALFGIYDWGDLVYLAQVLDIIVMVFVGYYSFSSIKEDKDMSSRTGIAIANAVFIMIAAYSLIRYIDNVDYNYIFLVIIDLMIYIMVQVGLIYRRIGLNVKEEKEFAQAKLYAFSDQLTGLGNRRHFYNIIEDYEKNRLPRDLTYIAIDVNRLKYYNDTFGHDAGDELLVGTASCLKLAFSSSAASNISRMGGDEFAILIVADPKELEKRISYLRTQLAHWHGKYVKGISVALGHASVKENPHYSIEELSNIADSRMYEDKKKYYETSGYDRRGQGNEEKK